MKKKLILVVTALTLCAAIAVGGTLAYLSAQSTELVNTFTYNADPNDPNNQTKIGVELSETEWKKDKEFQWGKENAAQGTPTGGFGFDKPLTPSATLNKNPQLRLTTKVDSYVGVGIKIEGMTWAQFDEIAIFKGTKTTTVKKDSQSTFGPGWVYHNEVNGVRYFIYNGGGTTGHTKGVLTQATNTTPPLFEQVKIKNAVEQEKLNAFLDPTGAKGKVNTFDLKIVGYAAQAVAEDSEGDLDNAKLALSQNFKNEFGGTSVANYPYVGYQKINNP